MKSRLVITKCAGYIFWQLFLWEVYMKLTIWSLILNLNTCAVNNAGMLRFINSYISIKLFLKYNSVALVSVTNSFSDTP